jgi:transcriptional regulator of heat shock response
MTIERTKNEVIFRLPNNINLDDLQDFADYFQYRTIAKKSKATQTEVDNLVKEIKKGRWDKTRKQLGL